MPPVSPLLPESARKVHAVLLQALANTGLDAVASHVGTSNSTISRMKTEEGAKIDWAIQGARAYAQQLRNADDLVWEDEL